MKTGWNRGMGLRLAPVVGGRITGEGIYNNVFSNSQHGVCRVSYVSHTACTCNYVSTECALSLSLSLGWGILQTIPQAISRTHTQRARFLFREMETLNSQSGRDSGL